MNALLTPSASRRIDYANNLVGLGAKRPYSGGSRMYPDWPPAQTFAEGRTTRLSEGKCLLLLIIGASSRFLGIGDTQNHIGVPKPKGGRLPSSVLGALEIPWMPYLRATEESKYKLGLSPNLDFESFN